MEVLPLIYNIHSNKLVKCSPYIIIAYVKLTISIFTILYTTVIMLYKRGGYI